jgi:hypothetical protein
LVTSVLYTKRWMQLNLRAIVPIYVIVFSSQRRFAFMSSFSIILQPPEEYSVFGMIMDNLRMTITRNENSARLLFIWKVVYRRTRPFINWWPRPSNNVFSSDTLKAIPGMKVLRGERFACDMQCRISLI